MNRTVLLLTGFLLLFAATPASAELTDECDAECQDRQYVEGKIGHVIDAGCEIIYIHGNMPAPVMNPLLGIVGYDLDLEGCTVLFNEHPFGWTYFQYDGRN